MIPILIRHGGLAEGYRRTTWYQSLGRGSRGSRGGVDPYVRSCPGENTMGKPLLVFISIVVFSPLVVCMTLVVFISLVVCIPLVICIPLLVFISNVVFSPLVICIPLVVFMPLVVYILITA